MSDALLQDVRYGIRQLFRQPTSSLIAVVTLALGIGASSAIFSVIDATMLRPLPYPDPEQMVRVLGEMQRGDRTERPMPSMADLRTWQTATDVVTSVAGWGRASRGRITDGPEPERLEVLQFTEDYLSMHGVAPILGRGFERADTDSGSPLVALVSHGYWRSRYGARREVIGETVRLDDEVATIVGVLPAWFNATTPLSLPLRVPPAEYAWRGTGRVQVIARLRAGVTIDQARVRLSAIMAPAPGPRGETFATHAYIESLLGAEAARYRTMVAVLATAVALVLLIACVNVAGLLIARGAARQSEIAVRALLGAGRARLAGQLLTETLVLAVPGGVLGLLLAWSSLGLLVANMPLSMPKNVDISVNARVLAATCVLLLATAMCVGLFPAMRLSGMRAYGWRGHHSLHGTSSLTSRGGQLLIAAEVALAVVLVAGAGLMIRSVLRIAAADLGFNPEGIVTMQVQPLERTPAAHTAYYDALLPRLRTMPGVLSAGLVDAFVLGDRTWFTTFVSDDARASAAVFRVTPGYLETIGARLRAGRLPTDADRATRLEAAVVTDTAARALFGGRDPLGRTFTAFGRDERLWTVIGVIAELRHNGPLSTRRTERDGCAGVPAARVRER